MNMPIIVRKVLARAAAGGLVAGALITASPLVAQACACGGMVTDPNSPIDVQRETAVVRLDSVTEDGAAKGGATNDAAAKTTHETVTMQFAAQTNAKRVAFVMPVPAPATFNLGDQALFDELDKLSAPEVRKQPRPAGDGNGGDGAAAAAPGQVTVTDHVTIGPYEVAELAGKDPSAIATWLSQHGFTLRPKLADGLRGYLSTGWQVVAVKLAAGGGKTLQGELPPLTVAFDTTSPVYPMKLSALAEHPQSLRLYVLAAHKVSVAGPAPSTGDLTLSFAGRSDDSAYPHIPDIGGRPAFVTRYDGQWSTPSVITDDVHMTPTASDATYRQTVIEYVNDDGTDTPHSAQANGSAIAAWSAVGGVGVLLIAALWVLINRRRTRPADRR